MSQSTSAQPYDGRGSESPQWWPSRYGPDDELGAGNELTSERTLAALRIPREGRKIELAQLLEEGVPAFPPRTWKQLVLAHGTLDATKMAAESGGSQMTYFEESAFGTYHIGCHVDGLGHVGIDGHFYNGHHYKDFYTAKGLTKFGVETMRPWVTRGVCLNIAALLGTEQLDEGFVITPEHLEEACRAQDVEIGAGDVVLLHTGWGSLWSQDIEHYEHVEPGAGWDAAHWLTDRRVSLVGADNWAFEVIPFERPDGIFVVHQHLLAETGTHILENATTTELAATGRSEFLFVLTVQKTKGSTGAYASPVAVI
ncbi:MAG: cyclase family protein [Actinomycetota bacterium]|nr:cyclase family protein [Actinomycetota bacterium]